MRLFVMPDPEPPERRSPTADVLDEPLPVAENDAWRDLADWLASDDRADPDE